MVSFFGLRFGGDKKKSQKADKKQPQQEQQQSNRLSLGQGQLGGRDFSQSEQCLPRPETSNSTGRLSTEAPAAASMIDLSSSHRQPGQFSGGETSKTDGAASLAIPNPFASNCRPGTPSRQQGSRSDFKNHPDAPGARSSEGSPGQGAADTEHDVGCPSPPPSIGSGGELRPSISVTSSSRLNLTTLASTSGNFGPAPLPSPVPSAAQSGEEKWEVPVIRNVKAKRDTLTFLSPRRQSFIMSIEEADRERQRSAEVAESGLEDSATGSLGIELMQSPVEMTEPHPFRSETDGSQQQMSPEGAGAQPNPDAGLFERSPPRGFNSSRGPRQPLGPLTISTNMSLNPESSALTPGVADKPLPSPLASKVPMEGDFPVIRGLPRGRMPPLPSIAFSPSQQDDDDNNNDDDQDGEEEDEEDEDEEGEEGLSAAAWDFNGQQPRMSAMPAPLLTKVSSVSSRESSAQAAPLDGVALEGGKFEISLDIPQSPMSCEFGINF